MGWIVFGALCFIPINDGPLKELLSSPSVITRVRLCMPESAFISTSWEMRVCVCQGRLGEKALLQTSFIFGAEESTNLSEKPRDL